MPKILTPRHESVNKGGEAVPIEDESIRIPIKPGLEPAFSKVKTKEVPDAYQTNPADPGIKKVDIKVASEKGSAKDYVGRIPKDEAARDILEGLGLRPLPLPRDFCGIEEGVKIYLSRDEINPVVEAMAHHSPMLCWVK